MSLTRNQVLAKRTNPARSAVDVPGLDGQVFVRVLSLGQLVRIQHDSAALQAEGKGHLTMVRLVTEAACDEDGVALFGPEDEEALLGLPLEAVKAIADAAMALNKIGDDAAEAARKN